MSSANNQGLKQVRLNGYETCQTYEFEADGTLDVLFLVPGTTDPVNFNEKEKNNADITYWDEQFIKDMDKLTNEVPLKIYSKYFSWSGDNNRAERKKAGKVLLSYILGYAVAQRDKNIPVNIHLICHSHGGNAIHEFTQYAAQDKDFPSNFKVRSIVYLSTPFFKNQAQINHAVLHPGCKIYNVYNKYDLTQRFVANFSMFLMPTLVRTFEWDDTFMKELKFLKELPYKTMMANAALMGGQNTVTDGVIGLMPFSKVLPNSGGHALWTEVRDVFKAIDTILDRCIFNLTKLNAAYPEFITTQILQDLRDKILIQLRNTISSPITNLNARIASNRNFSMATLFDDIGPGLSRFIEDFNDFIKFKSSSPTNPTGLNSALSEIIDRILLNQIDLFDNTTHDPAYQFNGKYKITTIDVTHYDPYDKTSESKNYDKFITRLEELENQYESVWLNSPEDEERSAYNSVEGASIRSEILFTLLAQENYGVIKLIDTILDWMDFIMGGKKEALIRHTRKTIAMYKEQLVKRDYKILHHAPPTPPSFSPIPVVNITNYIKQKVSQWWNNNTTMPFSEVLGSIPYLAVQSHSTSRRALRKELEKAWRKDGLPIKNFTMYTVRKKSC